MQTKRSDAINVNIYSLYRFISPSTFCIPYYLYVFSNAPSFILGNGPGSGPYNTILRKSFFFFFHSTLFACERIIIYYYILFVMNEYYYYSYIYIYEEHNTWLMAPCDFPRRIFCRIMRSIQHIKHEKWMRGEPHNIINLQTDADAYSSDKTFFGPNWSIASVSAFIFVPFLRHTHIDIASHNWHYIYGVRTSYVVRKYVVCRMQ